MKFDYLMNFSQVDTNANTEERGAEDDETRGAHPHHL
jgi:hypothetical protein